MRIDKDVPDCHSRSWKSIFVHSDYSLQGLFHGDFVQYIVDSPVGQLTVRRPPTESFDEGAAVTLSFAPEHCVLLEG